ISLFLPLALDWLWRRPARPLLPQTGRRAPPHPGKDPGIRLSGAVNLQGHYKCVLFGEELSLPSWGAPSSGSCVDTRVLWCPARSYSRRFEENGLPKIALPNFSCRLLKKVESV